MNRVVWTLLAGTGVLVLAFNGLNGARAADSSGRRIYAQALVEREAVRHPELAKLAMHVTPPGGAANLVIGSTDSSEVGHKSGAETVQVARSGKFRSRSSADGTRFEVELPLQDASVRTVGTLDVVLKYHPGDNTHALEAQAQAVRDELRRRISHTRNLLEPAQLDTRVRLDSYGQQLLDESLEQHPDVIIMALHATVPGTHDNVIVASNIGRIGKKADEDDMRVVDTGKPNLEVNETGDRFEVELVLEDVAGRNIGAIGVVYPYKAGDDKGALQHKAEQVRDELARRIPDGARLFEAANSTSAKAPASSPTTAAVTGASAVGGGQAVGGAQPAPLRLLGRTELPGYSGDFDHFAADLGGIHLFLAAEDHGTLEVFDLRTGLT